MSTISIDVRSRTIPLSKSLKSQVLSPRSEMLERFKKDISLAYHPYSPHTIVDVDEVVIERMVAKFSERVIYRPLDDIRYWDWTRKGLNIEPGYPPFYYSSTKDGLPVNATAVGGLGEGVAGLLAQRIYKARKVTRPYLDYPDAVMECGGVIYLVEAKATTVENDTGIRATAQKELVEMARLMVSCEVLNHRRVRGLVVGTRIVDPSNYRSYITELVA